MARKSSKTAHVMNLLAGGEAESPKSEAAKENLAASQAAESKGTIKELTVLAQQASIQMQEGPLSPSPISIIDLSSSVQDPVAELIRQQLEEDEMAENQTDLNQDGADNEIAEPEEESVSDLAKPDLDEEPEADTEELPTAEPYTEQSDNQTNTENELSNSDGSDTDDGVPTDLSDSDNRISTDLSDTDEQHPADLPDTDDQILKDLLDTDNPSSPATPNFKYLNVMEHVVENIAKNYMERLGGCTCDRCIADVIALTLTKLPPKYVVVEPPAASPLLNFYSSRFAPHVIVEVTKSCFTVKENPHH
nr:late competence development ComFB family protein [uncultured Clostridium sp.]